MNQTTYITSKIDGKSYCKINGQFSRHLKTNGLTYKDYFEKYITGITPICECGRPKTFYQKTETYANSCGSKKCVGISISQTKEKWTTDQKLQDSINKKESAKFRTSEQKHRSIEKAKATFKEKYGVEWISQSLIQKSKSQQTKLARYGSTTYNNSVQSQEKNKNKTVNEHNIINNKRRQTNLERYGVENCFLKPEIRSKSAKSNSEGRDFILPSGKNIKVRGYEDRAITKLLETYHESELIVHDMFLPYSLPMFEFVNVNLHTSKYYPDIYIPKENKIIEVKSR